IPPPPSPRDLLMEELANECNFVNKYNSAQREHQYPFNKASKIELIAFKQQPFGNTFPHKFKDVKNVLERVILNKQQRDSLTSLLYNVGYTIHNKVLYRYEAAASYQPSNGIVFLDKNGKAFE